jgi:hypothetical protein
MNEEAKLRAKYGGALPRQQNMLTKKLITKVKNQKFFSPFISMNTFFIAEVF